MAQQKNDSQTTSSHDKEESAKVQTPAKRADKQQRLADRLRDNLKRRKQKEQD